MLRASGQPDSPQIRQAIKNQLITRVLVQQAAEKANYADKPEVKAAVQQAKTNAEVQLYLRDNVKPEPVTEEQVKARYDELVAALGKNEYKPRLIIVQDPVTAATVLSELKAGKSFEGLARQYSMAPSRDTGGELPWVSFHTPATEGKTSGLPLPVAQALEKLKVGAVTNDSIPVDGVRAIVKLDAKRPTQVPGFATAKPGLQQQLQAAAVEGECADDRQPAEGREDHAVMQSRGGVETPDVTRARSCSRSCRIPTRCESRAVRRAAAPGCRAAR